MAIDVSSAFFFSPFSPISTPSIPCLIRSVKRLPFPPSPWSCSSSSFRFSSNYAAPGSSSNRSSYSRRWINPLSNGTSQEVVRQWIEADTSISSQDKFTVASYNILGDRNASKHRDLYSNIPSSYINWGRRKRVICEELMEWDPDIICLQEVDRYFDLSEDLRRGGYAGSYKKRTGDSADGCAIFWKSNKFRVLQAESIEFKSIGLRDNVAQLSIFEMCKGKSQRLIVGNIHVLYNPSRGEVKLGQIRTLSSRAHILANEWGNIPVLVAGDFNATPPSAIYKYLSTSELDILLHDRRELSGQRSCHPAQVFGLNGNSMSSCITIERSLNSGWSEEEIRTVGANAGVVTHRLKLNSSYATINGSATRDPRGEPLATSYHSKFFGTVDYIWYTDGLEPTRVLDTPSVDVLRRTGGLPCKNVGSDHLALVAEFAFTNHAES